MLISNGSWSLPFSIFRIDRRQDKNAMKHSDSHSRLLKYHEIRRSTMSFRRPVANRLFRSKLAGSSKSHIIRTIKACAKVEAEKMSTFYQAIGNMRFSYGLQWPYHILTRSPGLRLDLYVGVSEAYSISTMRLVWLYSMRRPTFISI